MTADDLVTKKKDYEQALGDFVDRLREDRYVLAAVLVGSLADEVIWRKESLWMWIIETDGVSKRLRADGNDERIFRNLVENGVNIHAEIIPRARFKQMVEGSARTAFSYSYFARRELVYCDDPSISDWFETANTIAPKDQEKELLAVTTWAIHAHRHARKLIEIKQDLELAKQELIWAAHSIAAIEIVANGEVVEDDFIYRAIELDEDLFQAIYIELISKKPTRKQLESVLERIHDYLLENWGKNMEPLTHYLRKQNRVVPLSEISDHFAHTQLYPWHLESACDWLERQGLLEKVSMPFKLTIDFFGATAVPDWPPGIHSAKCGKQSKFAVHARTT